MIEKLKELSERKDWIIDQIKHLDEKKKSIAVQIEHLENERKDVIAAIGGIENAQNEAAELISKLANLGYDVVEKAAPESLLTDLIIDLGGKDNLLHFYSNDLNIIHPIRKFDDICSRTIRIERDMQDFPVLDNPEIYEYYKEICSTEFVERKVSVILADEKSHTEDMMCRIEGMHITYHKEEFTPILHLMLQFEKIPPRA